MDWKLLLELSTILVTFGILYGVFKTTIKDHDKRICELEINTSAIESMKDKITALQKEVSKIDEVKADISELLKTVYELKGMFEERSRNKQ